MMVVEVKMLLMILEMRDRIGVIYLFSNVKSFANLRSRTIEHEEL